MRIKALDQGLLISCWASPFAFWTFPGVKQRITADEPEERKDSDQMLVVPCRPL